MQSVCQILPAYVVLVVAVRLAVGVQSSSPGIICGVRPTVNLTELSREYSAFQVRELQA